MCMVSRGGGHIVCMVSRGGGGHIVCMVSRGGGGGSYSVYVE